MADDSYIRESILDPNAKIVAGFEPIHAEFQGTIERREVIQLIAYVKSLSLQPPVAAGALQPAPDQCRPAKANAGATRREPARPYAKRPQVSQRQRSKAMRTVREQSGTANAEVNYLNVEHGWKSLAVHHGPQADRAAVPVSITLFFFVGGAFAVLMRLNLLTPEGDLRQRTPTTSCSRCTASSWCSSSWSRRFRRCWAISWSRS